MCRVDKVMRVWQVPSGTGADSTCSQGADMAMCRVGQVPSWLGTVDKSDVHVKGQVRRSKVKVIKIKTNVAPIWAFAKSLKLHRKGVLLFQNVIRQIWRSHWTKNCQFLLELSVSGLQLLFEFTDGYKIMHKAWGHTRRALLYFQDYLSNFKVTTFPDNISNLNSRMATISNAFSWMKILEFWLKFHWSLFLSVKVTIFQHWFE